MSEFGSSHLSTKIDQRSVLNYMIEKSESALGEAEALCLELLPEDEANLPTPQEVYDAYRHIAFNLCCRLKADVNNESFLSIATSQITTEGKGLIAKIAEYAYDLDNVTFRIGELENDGLYPEGFPPLNTPAAESLEDFISAMTSKKTDQNGATVTEEHGYGGRPTFAHHATNMYYTAASELLVIAKPLSKENDDEMLGSAERLFIFFLPKRTKQWIDDSRKNFGFPVLVRI